MCLTTCTYVIDNPHHGCASACHCYITIREKLLLAKPKVGRKFPLSLYKRIFSKGILLSRKSYYNTIVCRHAILI